MATWNKELQGLTIDEINQVSKRFLMGWQDFIKDGYSFRVKGLNARRIKLGMKPLTKEWSNEYRINYVQTHYSYDDIYESISTYLLTHRVGDSRWEGIEILDCRFGREYARLFKQLLGSSTWRKLSEQTRVEKLVETQMQEYGGVGVGGKEAYTKMINTKLSNAEIGLKQYQLGNEVGLNVFASIAEKEAFDMLVSRFGRKDVFYQYGLHPLDKRYPYPCDFYIKSLDLFIEFHFHYSHGRHWYDENNHDDQLRVKHLLESDNITSIKSVQTWCVKDIEKREKARSSGIKYLVFFDGDYMHRGRANGKRLYGPKMLKFREWFIDYDCDYESFIKDNPGNTY